MLLKFALRLTSTTTLAWLFCSAALVGQTFYIATDGDNGGDGSSGSPWATLEHAVSQVPDGAEIVVEAGLYQGSNQISRQFANGITVRSETTYGARFLHNGPVIVGTDCQGIRFEGFEFEQQTGFPQDNLVMFTGNTQRLTFYNNIFHDAVRLSLLHLGPGAVDVTVQQNVFYNAGLQSNANHVRVEGGRDVTVIDNIFFNDYAGSGRTNTNNSGAFVYVTNLTNVANAGNIQIRRNIMLAWQGLDNESMIQLGDRTNSAAFDVDNALVENNLMLGDGIPQFRAAMTLENVNNITIRNNTVSGDFPSLAYAFHMISSAPTIRNNEIFIYNNIWSDQVGTMGGFIGEGVLDFCDCLPDFTNTTLLANNLYFNGGNELPFDAEELLNPVDDATAVVGDPLLGAPVGIILPRWGGTSFTSGEADIRAEFVRLAELYGQPGVGSPAINGAASGPADDLLGNLRGGTLDLGAVEFSPCSLAGDVEGDLDVDRQDLNVLASLWTSAAGNADINNDGVVSVLDAVALVDQINGCGAAD